jgi:hypothetical protein
VGTSQIDSFTVGLSGRLTAAPGSPFTAQGVGPFDSQFRPAGRRTAQLPLPLAGISQVRRRRVSAAY